MKKTKQETLFVLSLGSDLRGSDFHPLDFRYEQLYALCPFEQSTVRGNIAALKDEKFVSTYLRSGNTFVSLTIQGRDMLRSLFPAFRPVQQVRRHRWLFAFFYGAAEGVARTLREELLRAGFFFVNRGLYVYPYELSQETRNTLAAIAGSSLMLVEGNRFYISDERSLLSQLYPVDQLSRIGNLLLDACQKVEDKLAEGKPLHHQTIQSYIQSVGRLEKYFTADLSLLEEYFPQIIQSSSIITTHARVSQLLLPQISVR